eukprot:CAMPEP_0182447358 /NCGR_PEP_ID=MMETSP1172-20130603/15124_1 /TAXON_ID=708627 /ORGANISM="Timspurckia oligopyrenoides, Strain CCMP3278" /LENGTH=253 /DNA_ID=CAMNT_0024643763 /DNA_START=204 /DNA_END=965 /DNA_ORIENTATION=-
MADYELLVRGTGFFMRGIAHPSRLYGAVAGHVCAPFRFRHYYPHQTWLDFVEHHHTKNKLEFYMETDGVLNQTNVQRHRKASSPLRLVEVSYKHAFLHPSLDLAILELSHAQNSLEKELNSENVVIEPLRLDLLSQFEQDELEFLGHSLDGESGSGVEEVLIERRTGNVSYISGSRIFVKTNEISVMGMCGCPVVSRFDLNQCAGMLEGVVAQSARHPETGEDLKDHSVVIPSEAIREFLIQIEGKRRIHALN